MVSSSRLHKAVSGGGGVFLESLRLVRDDGSWTNPSAAVARTMLDYDTGRPGGLGADADARRPQKAPGATNGRGRHATRAQLRLPLGTRTKMVMSVADLDGKVALVTGGASGIGRAIAGAVAG